MTTRIRRPWWAFLLAFLLSSVVAMLYVGRPRRALAYAAATLAALAIGALAIWAGRAWSIVFVVVGFHGVALVAALDAFRIARVNRAHFSGAWYTRWHALLGILVLLQGAHYATVFLVRAYVIEPFRIPAGSMRPTFAVGDFIAAYKWPYGNPGTWDVWLTNGSAPADDARPARGDIILFRYPGNPETVYIKRVIGLPGDVVRSSGHELIVNGEPAKRTFVAAIERADDKDETALDVYEETLAGRSYRIALHKGPPPGDRLFEAKVPVGHYFVLGDNRDNSNDSRYWGFVPETYVVGRPVVIWFSMNAQGGMRSERIGVRPR